MFLFIPPVHKSLVLKANALAIPYFITIFLLEYYIKNMNWKNRNPIKFSSIDKTSTFHIVHFTAKLKNENLKKPAKIVIVFSSYKN